MGAQATRNMTGRSLFIPIVLALVSLPMKAAEPALPSGFEHFYNLEYTEALDVFREAVKKAPDNPDAHNHLAQTLLYKAMFEAGALESELVSGTNPFIRREKLAVSASTLR